MTIAGHTLNFGRYKVIAAGLFQKCEHLQPQTDSSEYTCTVHVKVAFMKYNYAFVHFHVFFSFV